MRTGNPYVGQPRKAFWRPAVAERHVSELDELWRPVPLAPEDRVATAGSCFAQHIGRRLRERGAAYLDLEPAPDLFADEAEARRFGFGVYSCRYGNIYTTRQLVQLIEEAFGRRRPADPVWEAKGRFFDALRPSVDPVGQDSPGTVLALRERHLARVREMFLALDLFVFTLGLTEGWESVEDGTMHPSAPGAVCGTYDPARHRLRNLRAAETREDLERFREALRAVNPTARILLTVSPVPLTATATAEHVLTATVRSKSVLRAVAGEMAEDHEDVAYFPSYEIVAAHPSRGAFYNPDLRTVSEAGVDLVMTHFFRGPLAEAFAGRAGTAAETMELICDEEKLEAALD